MRNHGITALSAGLILLAVAGTADAGQGRSSHRQTEGMIERLHGRDDRHAHHGAWNHGRDEWRRADRGRNGREHGHRDDSRYGHDRVLHWGHEHWREGGRHFYGGRGYWHDYHSGRHHHPYRHRFYNNYHYYYDTAGFYFPGYGFIERGHMHGRHCPHWHHEDFAAVFVLGAIIFD